MAEPTLTGQIRFRNHQGLLVVQVQERVLATAYHFGCINTDWIERWRDASIEDLTQMEMEG